MKSITAILNEEYARINERAERERIAAAYISGLFEKNYDKLVEIFGKKNDRKLYDSLKSQLERVVRIVEGTGGTCGHGNSEHDPSILLGWLEVFKPKFDESVSEDMKKKLIQWDRDNSPRCFYRVVVTDLGEKVVGEYKKRLD